MSSHCARNSAYLRTTTAFAYYARDAADYIAALGQSKDVILADACDHEGVAPELNTIEFYENVRRCLAGAGVFVANMCGDQADWDTHMDKIRTVFGDELLTLQVRPDGNLIVFAFKERRPDIDWERLAATALTVRREFGLDCPRYLRRIALRWKLRRGSAPLYEHARAKLWEGAPLPHTQPQISGTDP